MDAFNDLLYELGNVVVTTWNYGTVPAWLALVVSLWGFKISYSTQKRTQQLENRREESLYRCEVEMNQLTVSNHNDKNPISNVTVVRAGEDLTKDSIAPKDSHTFTLADGDNVQSMSVMFRVLHQDWVMAPGKDAQRAERPSTIGLRIRTFTHIKMGKLPKFIKTAWEELRRRQ